MNIRDLMERRAEAVEKARAILNAAEGRELTAEEKQQYEGYDQEIDALKERIELEQKQEARERELETVVNRDRNPALRHQPGAAPEERDGDRTDSREYRQSLIRYMAGQGVDERLVTDGGEKRAVLGVNIGTASAGGVLAPTVLERTLLDLLKEYNVMRGLASVRSSNNNLEIPVSTGHTTAYHIDEGADFTKSTPSFDKKSFAAYKTGVLSVVSHEAMQDVFLDMEGWLRDDFARALARMEEEDFTKGDGTKKPRGFTVDAATGVTAAAAAAITGDELIDLQHSLPRQYRDKAVWVLHDSVIKAVRKLKSSDNQYLWQPGLQAGQPDMLLGHRVVLNEFMDDLGAGKKPVAYGDFSMYRVIDRRGLYFQRLDELYATSGQVGFLAYRRSDAKLLDVNAIKLLAMAAGT